MHENNKPSFTLSNFSSLNMHRHSLPSDLFVMREIFRKLIYTESFVPWSTVKATGTVQ